MTDKAFMGLLAGFFALLALFLILALVDYDIRLEGERARNQVLTISLEAAERERLECGCFTLDEVMEAMSSRGEER